MAYPTSEVSSPHIVNEFVPESPKWRSTTVRTHAKLAPVHLVRRFLNVLNMGGKCGVFLNLIKIGKQTGKRLAQLLTMIRLKGLNRGCRTGMSLNRLNREYEIGTPPQRVGHQVNVGNNTEVQGTATGIDKDSP